MSFETSSYMPGDEFLYFFTGDKQLEKLEPLKAEAETLDTSVSLLNTENATVSQENNYLRYFTSLQFFICLITRPKSSMPAIIFKSPKREYVRTKLIRGHKKAIRQSLMKKRPKKVISTFNYSDSMQMEAWKAFKAFNQIHKDVLNEISKTEKGPNTDGKNKRPKDTQSEAKTYNNPFCILYFSDPIVRTSFKLYSDLVFTGKSCDENCDGFAFSCCDRKSPHSDRCQTLWNDFEKQVKDQFLDVMLKAQKYAEA